MDSTRPTPPNGDVAGSPSRTLKTLIVYPARGKPGSVDADEPADLVKAVRDRAPVSGAERFPLLVYAHGLSGGFVSTFVTSSAAAGYVVVARAFPLSKKDAPGGPSAADYANQPGDVSFVISQMLHVPRRDHDLQRIIDPKAVGVTGALVTLIGAPHIRFGPPWEAVAVHSQIDFLDRYLKHQARGLRQLKTDTNVPGVASLQ